MSTRFESSSLSKLLDDQAVATASAKFVRLIVRRPHAYEFRRKFKGREVHIPGLIVLDGDGNLVGTAPLEPDGELARKLNDLAK